MRIDLAKDRDPVVRGGGMGVLMTMRWTLGVRVVVMVCMLVVMKMFVLGRWGEEKPGVNVEVRPARVIVVERGDLRLAKKSEERSQNREREAARVGLREVERQV
jgi:hypothetical protein